MDWESLAWVHQDHTLGLRGASVFWNLGFLVPESNQNWFEIGAWEWLLVWHPWCQMCPPYSLLAATESQYMRDGSSLRWERLGEAVGGSLPCSFTQLLLRIYSVPRITFPVVKVWGFCYMRFNKRKRLSFDDCFVVIVQSPSRARPFLTPWTAACQVCPSPHPTVCLNSCPLSWCYHHLVLCFPLLFLLSIFPSIRIFSSRLAVCIRWPKDWSFSFSISPSNEYSGLISFRIDWFDLLAVQGTLKSPLKHHCLKASVLRCSAFFMVQLISVHDHWKNYIFD